MLRVISRPRRKPSAFWISSPKKKPYVKIGMELYYAEGPQIVREIKARGHRIFLDLKLHDIPNTVKKAMKVLSGLDVDMCNLHAGGTIAMMEAALEGLDPRGRQPAAFDRGYAADLHRPETYGRGPLDRKAHWNRWSMHYAANAKKAGLDGVVCSPLEAARVHETCGREFLTVTPGVRFADGEAGDQVRVTTPATRQRDRFRLYRGRAVRSRRRQILWRLTADACANLSAEP